MRFLLAFLLLICPPALGQDLDKPMMLVANPELQGPYRGTVLLAAPINGRHVGVILNRPTGVKLGDLFPDHPPFKAVTDSVYIGGGENGDSVFALMRSSTAPHPEALELADGFWLVLNKRAIDNIVEATPNEARYFVGLIVWRPGELAEEISKRYFFPRHIDQTKIMPPDTSHLWDELVTHKGQSGV